MTARPKRGAAQRANYVINYITLNYKEEQDLRKAIQASLSEVKTTKRKSSSNLTSSNSTIVSNSIECKRNENEKFINNTACSSKSSNNHTSSSIVSPVLASVVKKKPPSPTPSKDTIDSSTNTSSSALEKKKPKIPSQRKFAQNSTSLGSSTNTTPVKFGPFTPLIPTNEIFPAIKPATEDFLTFLCLRKTSLLPRKLNMFALNEEAMKNKKIEKPFTTKINQTPTKQEPTQSTSTNNAKSKSKSTESKNANPPTTLKNTSKVEEKPVKNQSTTKPTSSRSNSLKMNGKSGEVKKVTTSTSHTKSSKSGLSNNKVSSTLKERKISQANKVPVKNEPQKRITRSTSNVADDNVNTQLKKQHKKPTNVAAQKILKNAVSSKKKKITQSHLSTPRGFVLDRVTRSIKHLRSMEEVRFNHS